MQQASNTQNQLQIPSWLKIGYFIDLKDKQGEWRVALISNITKTQIRVRYDGWSSKFDQNFMIHSSNIRPFRSVIRGYTGQVQSPGPRQHYKFTQAQHKQNFENKINDFLQNIQSKSQLQINQFIRGSHYAWTDFLMSLTYNNQNQISLVYEYFFKHFELVMLYFKSMLKQKTLDDWFKNTVNQKSIEILKNQKSFAQSYYQIFDTVYSIMDGYPRLKVFFKSNQSLIANFIGGQTSHLQFMSEYLNQIGLHQILQQSIQKICSDKNSTISLSFITAFTRLFYTIQKTIKDKQKRKQLTQKLCQLILIHCNKMSEITVKEQEGQLQKIYATCKMMLLKYNWKAQFLVKFQIVNICCWRFMIMSQKLQRKIKAINKLKTYYSNITNSIKKQTFLIFNAKQTIEKQFKKQQILKVIFIGNQHHQIIKKGCQFVIQLYKEQSIHAEDLSIIWKSCRHRLQAVRKVMYTFFQQICKDLRHGDLMALAQWLVQQPLSQQIDKNFFYNFFKQVIQCGNAPAMNFLFQFAQKRVYQNKQQVKQFSQLLTSPKSCKAGFLQIYSNKIIKLIPIQQNNQDTLFLIYFANCIYYDTKNKHLNLESECFNIIFQSLCSLLKSKPKKQEPHQFQSKKQKVNQYLKLLQNISNQFQLQCKQFMNVWQLFSQQQNRQIRQSVFLPWILDISYKGFLKYEYLALNQCLYEKKLKKEIFNSILKKHTHIDYINLSEMEFKIFKKFLIEVNVDQGNLLQINNGWTGISYIRISQKCETIDGLKQLTDIFLNCRNQHVVRKAATLIKQLHLNYSTIKLPHNSQFRLKKVQQLLNKTQRYISDGVKKSNVRLIKNALYLLLDIAITVKQVFIIPYNYPNRSHSLKNVKKTFKIIKDQRQLFNIDVVTTNTIKSLKKTIAQQLNLPLYNIKIYRTFYEIRKIDDDGASVSSASVSSQSSCPSDNNRHRQKNYTIIKNKMQQEIPNQYLYSPIWSISTQFDDTIVVTQTPNIIYTLIQKFINEKVSEQLLKILADTDYYSKQTSQLAYNILIEVSSSNSSAFQILNNLIAQLKNKYKNNNNNNEISGLQNQSVNFRLYFCKNINRLTNQDMIILTQNNMTICTDILKQLTRQITQLLQIDLLFQILSLIKKSITVNKTLLLLFNPQTVFICIINLLQFINLTKQVQQFKKQQHIHLQHNHHNHLISQIKVFIQCWNIIQVTYYNNNNKIIDIIVQNQRFSYIMSLLYKKINKKQFGQIFAQRLQKILKNITKLSQKTQQILYHVIFMEIYCDILQNKNSIKNKKNMGIFKIIYNFILISSFEIIKRLFIPQNIYKNDHEDGGCHSFWTNCIKIIQQQSDYYDQFDKQNKYLSGHLYIMQSLILKNPSALTKQLCQFIIYNFLCYRQNYTLGQQIKSVSKGSIFAALILLEAIAKSNQKYMKIIINAMRKYQQISYWRTPDFWATNLQNQTKSSTGFVGLENPGCICYLNSFTQILFMNTEFRLQVCNFQQIDQNKDYSLLHQLRKIFLNLQYSNRKYLNPVPFTTTIKNTQNKPMIKIYEQMDIQQYSSILFDKIQKLLPKDKDFVKQIYGGTYSNDIISKQCKHCSQRQQSFLSIQVDVKSNLQQSLKSLVKGQILQGQNAYFCQKCNIKVKALKRMSIKKLPNNVIICLKRFQYNFETDQKFKINSCCQFPKQITFQHYSQQYLNSQQQIQQNIKIQQAETQLPQKLSHQYFQYKLKGVIIHKGSSESGHYYALIEVSGDNNQKWLQFNDSCVTEFDVQNLADEAYGSDDPSNPKSQNAYMLVYQRKKKIKNQPKMQQNNPKVIYQNTNNNQTKNIANSKIYNQQSIKLLNQIIQRNKQIQTFNMIFSTQYRIFITHMILHTLQINYTIWQQYTTLLLKQTQRQKQSIPNQLSKINQYHPQTVEQALKYFLEYCFFVKARQSNISQFIQNLKQLDNLFKLKCSQPVVNYFIHELSQKLLIQELFVEISMKEKVMLIAYFVCNIIVNKLKNKEKDIEKDGQNRYVILKFVKSMVCVMVQNNLCVNQLMYIIRSICDQNIQFLNIFQQLNIFDYIFNILIGVKQNQQQKYLTIQAIKSDFDVFLKRQEKKFIKQKQMKQQDNLYSYYQIQTVKKTGKCLLKIQSPQQAWNFLYLVYRLQSDILRKNFNNGIPVTARQLNVLTLRRQNFQNQFIKLKQNRICHFIEQCHGSKTATSLALFLCQVAHENKVVTQKLIQLIKKGLKTLQATKFRPYLILLYYMVMHEDSLIQKKIQCFFSVLQFSLSQNSKYFSQSDILQQWIMKLVLNSAAFAKLIVRKDSGVQLINQVLQKLSLHKKPTAQLMKKQKNQTYERLNYQIHGLFVSTEYQDYQVLYNTKNQFFMALFDQRNMPLELLTRIRNLLIPQLNYKQLVHKPQIGEIMLYLFKDKWTKVLVRFSNFGHIKINKIIKQKQVNKNTGKGNNNAGKKKQYQNKRNILSIKGVDVDIGQGNILCQDQYFIWLTQQRLRVQVVQDLSNLISSNNTKQNNPKSNIMQIEQYNSDVSYQSSSGNN